MKKNPQVDSWYSRVDKIKNIFGFKNFYGKPEKAGILIDKILKSKFDRFYIDEINKVKIGTDGLDHNKLRFYKNLRAS